MTPTQITEKLHQEAKVQAASNSLAQKMLTEFILSEDSFSGILAKTLSYQISGDFFSSEELHAIFLDVFENHPSIIEEAILDIGAIQNRDPACCGCLDPILFFKGFHAVEIYRVAHVFWEKNSRFLAKTFQALSSKKLSVDIHPAAKIGHGILMDHATNIVIGETAVIGNDVSILHGVTLGGTGNEVGDRHPKIGNGVMIGAHAQLLGNITIGERAKIGAGAVVLDDVPSFTTFAGVPAVQVGIPEDETPSLGMKQKFSCCFFHDP